MRKDNIMWIGLIGLLLWPVIGLGQKDIADLKKKVFDSKTVDEKIERLLDYTQALKRSEADTTIKYSHILIDLAVGSGNYDDAAEASGLVVNLYNTVKNDRKAAKKVIQSLLPFESEMKRTHSRGTLYSKLGGIHFMSNEFGKAIENYDLALERFGEKDSLFIADMHFFKGQAFNISGEFLKAIESQKRAYAVYESQKDSIYMIECLAELAILYGRNGLNEKALEENQHIDSLAKSIHYNTRIVTSTYNMATNYRKMGRIDKQLEFLKKGMALHNLYPDNGYYVKHMYLCALASFYSIHNNLPMAKTYLDSIEMKPDYCSRGSYGYSNYLLSKTRYLLASNQLSAAKPFVEKNLANSKNSDDFESKIVALDMAAKLYHKIGDPKAENKYLKQHYALKDSIFQNSKQNQLLFYQTEFETSRKEQQLRQQTAEIAQLEKEKEANLKLLISGLIGLSFLFGMLYLIKGRKQTMKEKKLQETFAAQLIEHKEKENKRISESLHDGLGQKLLLIKNQAILKKDQVAQEYVDQAISEVNGITKALHPLQLEQLGLTKAIQSSVDAFDHGTDIFFSTELDTIDGIFSKGQELNIYRMAQEVLNNVVKHSRAQACKVELKKLAKQILFTIKDNGQGFDWSSAYQRTQGLGLKTLRSRANQLNGTISFNSNSGVGTSVQFLFPLVQS